MRIDPEKETLNSWLGQFEGQDRFLAQQLVEELLYVKAVQFQERMLNLLRGVSEHREGPFGLYVERSVRKHKGVPNEFFNG